MSSIAASIALDGVRLEYMPHIKPCPWHDKTHERQANITYGTSSVYKWWVECKCCGARGPIAETQEEAVKKWNVI